MPSDYVVTRSPEAGVFDVLQLDRELKQACAKVAAVTVAHHCDPYVVFIHCSEPLTTEERAAIEQVVQAHRAQKQDGA